MRQTPLFLVTLASLSGPAVATAQCDTERINLSFDGQEAQGGESILAAVSSSGRYVTFASEAENLVPEDDNDVRDIFLRDLETDEIFLISVTSSGQQAISPSLESDVSADGRFVAFQSNDTTLEDGVVGTDSSIYLRDRELGTTVMVSKSAGGEPAEEDCGTPCISDDGRYVAFQSHADNLVPGDTDNATDGFLWDRTTGLLELFTVDSSGGHVPEDCSVHDLSPDGRYAVFHSLAGGLVEGDTNGWMDVFLRDLEAGVTTRVSVRPDGTEGDYHSTGGAVSSEGRFVAFATSAENLVDGDTNDEDDVLLWDASDGSLTRVSVSSSGEQANDSSDYPSISSEGRAIGFASTATNLVPDDDTLKGADIFVHERITGETRRVSVSDEGVGSDGTQFQHTISGGGCVVAFHSSGRNLVPGDLNDFADIFIRRCPAPAPYKYCPSEPNSSGGPASIYWKGSTTISDDDFTLFSCGAPAEQFGVFFYGPRKIATPFGDGYLCVGAGSLGLFRILPPGLTDAGGCRFQDLDFSDPPYEAGRILGGSTWSFQFWFRDPEGPGGSGFNLSDGLRATFCL